MWAWSGVEEFVVEQRLSARKETVLQSSEASLVRASAIIYK